MKFGFATLAALAGGATALALSLASATAFAATIVHVSLTGETGDRMVIAADTVAARAGEILFDVRNDASFTEHEMVLVKLKSPNEGLPLNATKHRIDESKVESMGEVAEIKGGDKGSLKVKLEPGAYMMVCNIKGHYEAGMAIPFTVTE